MNGSVYACLCGATMYQMPCYPVFSLVVSSYKTLEDKWMLRKYGCVKKQATTLKEGDSGHYTTVYCFVAFHPFTE